jgi:ribokinase
VTSDAITAGRVVDVVVIGRANVDITVRVPACPGPGQTVLSSDLAIRAGGKALNQAVAVNRLGGNAALVSRAGQDAWGELLTATLHEAGVDTMHFQLVPDARTGAAIVEITPDGENHVILAVSPGTELTARDVNQAAGRIDSRVTVTQLDLPAAPLHAVLAAPRTGILIGNLVPSPDIDTGILAALDVLVVNEHEAATILGQPQPDARQAAQALRDLGPRTTVVTAGPAGAAFATTGGGATIPARAVQAVDTTGAGDAFLGAFALHLARGAPIDRAVAAGVRAGAAAVQRHGAHL